jgi:hypothetical protein
LSKQEWIEHPQTRAHDGWRCDRGERAGQGLGIHGAPTGELNAMNVLRRRFLYLAAGTAALPALSRIAEAQTYPSRPITTIAGMTVLLLDKRLRRWSSFIGNGGLTMRTTILAYVIAIFGIALIAAGAWDIYVWSNEQMFEVTLSDYGAAIRTIAGGFIMIGLAQALRLLLEINVRIK